MHFVHFYLYTVKPPVTETCRLQTFCWEQNPLLNSSHLQKSDSIWHIACIINRNNICVIFFRADFWLTQLKLRIVATHCGLLVLHIRPKWVRTSLTLNHPNGRTCNRTWPKCQHPKILDGIYLTYKLPVSVKILTRNRLNVFDNLENIYNIL